MKLDPRHFELIFPTLAERNLGIPLYLKQLTAKHPAARLLVVEGFQTGVENINDQKEVTSYLAQVQKLCELANITILGVVHTSKQKQNARYENPRERIAGCGQWGGWSETVIMVEPQTDANGNEADLRTLQILPRNGRHLRFVLEFRDGLLVEQAPKLTNEQKLLSYCAEHAEDILSIDDIRGVTGLKDVQATAVANRLIGIGRLRRLDRNQYAFIPPKTES